MKKTSTKLLSVLAAGVIMAGGHLQVAAAAHHQLQVKVQAMQIHQVQVLLIQAKHFL